MKKTDLGLLGIDLGGTNIRVGLVLNGSIMQVSRALTPAGSTAKEVLDAIFAVVDTFDPASFASIGIGVPGLVDLVHGVVHDIVNIPSWKEVPLKDEMESRYGKPVFVNNDANCFASGEFYFGKGRNCKSLVGVCMGTGLGAGLIFDGSLYCGLRCAAGEIGYIPYLDSNYEHYCSGEFFLDKTWGSALKTSQQAQAGDVVALALYREFGTHVGSLLKTVMLAYDPEIIVLGGSLARSYPFFRDSMWAALQDFLFPDSLKNLRIEVSHHPEVAILGAASLACS